MTWFLDQSRSSHEYVRGYERPFHLDLGIQDRQTGRRVALILWKFVRDEEKNGRAGHFIKLLSQTYDEFERSKRKQLDWRRCPISQQLPESLA